MTATVRHAELWGTRKSKYDALHDGDIDEHIVAALNETIRLMAEIDKAIPKWPIE
ncbi:MAG: hypothetical protein ABIF82_13445 [Planctomycetota bacterium]